MNCYTYSEISIGDKANFEWRVTEDAEQKFREITGDINPLHYDDAFAVNNTEGKYGRHIVYGMLTASLLSTLAGIYMPGKYSIIHSIENLNFKNPVYTGDILTVTGAVIRKQDDLNLILQKAKITNQNGRVVLTAIMKIIVLK